jgi:hypothetical protein
MLPASLWWSSDLRDPDFLAAAYHREGTVKLTEPSRDSPQGERFPIIS